jgi:hypothetical protein
LQENLLAKSLQAYYRTPLNIGYGVADPGCFGLKENRELDPETMRPKPIADHKERAAHRAAAGLSIVRLVNRGLVKGCSRGKWRLTPKGVRVAKVLRPKILPLSKREVSRQIAVALDMRAAMHSVRGPRARRNRRPKASTGKSQMDAQALQRVTAARAAGIEIPFNY